MEWLWTGALLVPTPRPTSEGLWPPRG